MMFAFDRKTLAVAMTALCLSGCGTSSAPVNVAATKTVEAESGPMLPHPEFQNWSRFPVNSYIVRSRTVTNEHGKVLVTTKMWLESKTDSKVEVGSQVTVERPDRPLEVNPTDVVSYPAEFQLPAGMDKERFYIPSPKAKRLDDETKKVGDKEIQAEVYEWKENNEAGPMNVKLWRSIDVPGKIIHQEMLTESSQTSIIEDVVEMDLTGEKKVEIAKETK